MIFDDIRDLPVTTLTEEVAFELPDFFRHEMDMLALIIKFSKNKPGYCIIPKHAYKKIGSAFDVSASKIELAFKELENYCLILLSPIIDEGHKWKGQWAYRPNDDVIMAMVKTNREAKRRRDKLEGLQISSLENDKNQRLWMWEVSMNTLLKDKVKDKE